MREPIMDSITAALAAILRTVQTPGDFFAAGECALHVPLIEVEGIGPIALPLLPAHAAQLIAAAERAPYGRGADTLVDTSVRRTWQIGFDRVCIRGRQWPAMLDGIVERAASTAAPSARAARMCWCAPRTRRATSAGSRSDGRTSTI
jgi:hypothetical protein